jgi:P-type Ca2+ transporter type 2C
LDVDPLMQFLFLKKVRRDGEPVTLSAEAIVPGDVVLLQDGDVVAADMRICMSNNLQIDEAVLTGEPEPVEKECVLN